MPDRTIEVANLSVEASDHNVAVMDHPLRSWTPTFEVSDHNFGVVNLDIVVFDVDDKVQNPAVEVFNRNDEVAHHLGQSWTTGPRLFPRR